MYLPNWKPLLRRTEHWRGRTYPCKVSLLRQLEYRKSDHNLFGHCCWLWFSDHARHYSNLCDINKVVKVVHRNQSDSHWNQSSTWPSVLLLELYWQTNTLLPSPSRTHTHTHTRTHGHTPMDTHTHTHTMHSLSLSVPWAFKVLEHVKQSNSQYISQLLSWFLVNADLNQ